MVAQSSCPSFAFLEAIPSHSSKDGGYVTVAYIFQSTEKWPQLEPISCILQILVVLGNPPISNYCSTSRIDC